MYGEVRRALRKKKPLHKSYRLTSAHDDGKLNPKLVHAYRGYTCINKSRYTKQFRSPIRLDKSQIKHGSERVDEAEETVFKYQGSWTSFRICSTTICGLCTIMFGHSLDIFSRCCNRPSKNGLPCDSRNWSTAVQSLHTSETGQIFATVLLILFYRAGEHDH